MPVTLTLGIDTYKPADKAEAVYIDETATPPACGYVKVELNSLVTSVKDVPDDPLPLNYKPMAVSPSGDQVPNFIVSSYPKGQNPIVIVEHPLSKSGGTKTYKDKIFIFASNFGKLDANACRHNIRIQGGTSTYLNSLFVATLAKKPEWPCDDVVSATLNYTITGVEL